MAHFSYLHKSSFMFRAISSLGIWKERTLSDICSRIRIHLLSAVGNLYSLHTGFLNTGREERRAGVKSKANGYHEKLGKENHQLGQRFTYPFNKQNPAYWNPLVNLNF